MLKAYTDERGITDEKELVSLINQRYNISKEYRASFDDKFDQKYQYYRSYTEFDSDYWYRSQLFMPYVFSIIESITPDFVSAIIGGDDFFKTNGIGQDKIKAQSMQTLMKHQMNEQMQFYQKVLMWIKSILIFGNGVVYTGWQKETRNVTKREWLHDPILGLVGSINVKRTETLHNNPYIDTVFIKNFYPQPYKETIKDMSWCIERAYVDWDYIQKLKSQGVEGEVYKNLDKIASTTLPSGYKPVMNEMNTLVGIASTARQDPINKPVELIKYWRKDRLIMLVNQSVIIRDTSNPFDHGEIPYTDAKDYPLDKEFYGISDVDLLIPLQQKINDVTNLRLDNLMQLINRMFIAQKNTGINPDDFVSRPSGVIWSDDVNAVKPLITQDVSPNAYNEEEQTFKTMQRVSGAWDYCYSEDTEVLTDTGWKKMIDCEIEKDLILTINKDTREISYQKPYNKYVYPYREREMYHYQNKTVDILVTPNHKMLIERSGRGMLVKVKDVGGKDKVPRTGFWKGEDKKVYSLAPAVKFKNQFVAGEELPRIDIRMEDFLAFLGIYLAEGWVNKIPQSTGYTIYISQFKKETKDEIRELLNRFPFSFRETPTGFRLTDKRLWLYLNNFGKSRDKFIPRDIKNLSPYYLNILVDWLLKGDGNIYVDKNGFTSKRFYTISRRLADDFQEILVKIGRSGNVRIKKTTGNKDIFDIYIIVQEYNYFKDKKKSFLKKEEYKGVVSCLTVPNHTMYVRRNGKVLWCGNSTGATPQRQETATGIIKLQQAAAKRFGYRIKLLQRTGFKSILNQIMRLNQQLLPMGFKIPDYENNKQIEMNPWDISGDFGLTVTGSTNLAGLEERMIQLWQTAKNDPYFNQFELRKRLLNVFDIPDSDTLLNQTSQLIGNVQSTAGQPQGNIMQALQGALGGQT